MPLFQNIPEGTQETTESLKSEWQMTKPRLKEAPPKYKLIVLPAEPSCFI
jgi:hypothetical protein